MFDEDRHTYSARTHPTRDVTNYAGIYRAQVRGELAEDLAEQRRILEAKKELRQVTTFSSRRILSSWKFANTKTVCEFNPVGGLQFSV